MGKAAKVVADRARVYVARTKYISVVIFTTETTTLDLLKRSFGGNSYKHRTGYIWVISKRGDLEALARDLGEHADPKGAVRTKLLGLLNPE